MRHYPGPGFNGGNMLYGMFGFIGTLVLLGLLALFVIYLVKRSKGKAGKPGGFGNPQHHRPPMPPAVQILDERLARGEIEVEDYMTRKAALLGATGHVTNEWTPQQPPAEAPPTEETKVDPAG
ncbi:MAG TPA: SHOCT domain-containing protein [Propionicimonas sp.]|jgi:putative membrane protein